MSLHMKEIASEARKQSINVLVHHNLESLLSARVSNNKGELDGWTVIDKKETRKENILHDNSVSQGSV